MVGVVAGAIIVGTAYSAHQQRKANKQTRQANERAARIEAIRSQNERAQALRQNRINAAQVFAMGANAGVQGSSGVQGTIAALGTNEAINFQVAGAIDQLQQQRLRDLNQAAGFEQQAQYGQAVASVASTIGGAR